MINKKSFMLNVFIIILVFLCLKDTRSAICDKVSSLPNDFNSLLPDYTTLNQIHSLNYIFLDEEQIKTKISLTKPSSFKIIAYARNAEISFRVIKNQNELTAQEGLNLPVEFIDFNSEGDYTIIFDKIRDVQFNENDLICNQPYLQIEIFIERVELVNKKLDSLKKNNGKLPSLDNINLTNAISELMNSTKAADDFNEYADELGTSNTFKKYSFPIKKITYYENFGLKVYKDFEFEIPKINQSSNVDSLTGSGNSKENKANDISFKSLSFKTSFFTDFLLGGSIKLILIKIDETNRDISIKNQIENLLCVKEGLCLISQRSAKNKESIQAILTAGKYLLLFADLSKNDNKIILNKADTIPVTLRFKVKALNGQQENRYNCLGIKLPTNFNVRSHYYLKERIIMNLDQMLDASEFFIREDSIMRIVTFNEKGNAVNIKLFMEDNNKAFGSIIDTNNSTIKSDFNDILYNEFKLNNESQREILKSYTSSISESDGLVIPLKKGQKYKLVLEYKNTIISGNKLGEERTDCETIFVHWEIKTIELLKKSNSKSV